MFDSTTKESGLKTINVTVLGDYGVKIASTKKPNSDTNSYCAWLRKGDPYADAETVSMFIIEPVESGLYILAKGACGDAVFVSFGTLRECLDKVFTEFKKHSKGES